MTSFAATPSARITKLDHLVLTVADVQHTIEWYASHLGMTPQVFSDAAGKDRHALTFGDSKINLHQRGREFEPKAQHVQCGSADLCFITNDSVDEVLRKLKAAGVEVLEGGEVVERTGAVSKLRSVYIRDPDGNLIECVSFKRSMSQLIG